VHIDVGIYALKGGMAMKTWKSAWLLKVVLLFSSILLVSSCNKMKLFLPQWFNPKEKVVSETTGYDWPRWRGPDGNGISTETDWNPKALEKGPKIVWRINVGSGYSNVAIVDNRLYTMGQKREKDDINNIVFCLDVRNGKRIWKYSFFDRREPQPSPAWAVTMCTL
jgi:hypothetical protein